MKSESFKFTHGNIAEITLQVGGQQYRRNYDFTDTASLASEYYELFTQLGQPDLPLPYDQFASGQKFLCLFDLSPNASTFLPRIRRDSCRLQINFRGKLDKALTMLIISETPKIMTVDAKRNIAIC